MVKGQLSPRVNNLNIFVGGPSKRGLNISCFFAIELVQDIVEICTELKKVCRKSAGADTNYICKQISEDA